MHYLLLASHPLDRTRQNTPASSPPCKTHGNVRVRSRRPRTKQEGNARTSSKNLTMLSTCIIYKYTQTYMHMTLLLQCCIFYNTGMGKVHEGETAVKRKEMFLGRSLPILACVEGGCVYCTSPDILKKHRSFVCSFLVFTEIFSTACPIITYISSRTASHPYMHTTTSCS
ncbi:uncharacterized protein RCO7_14171 [Rhynchosporium graminicola]|uniref:Uncharacterized protein n=1 Tax=Rhynchosporium graminicola TaxID=2792576 RepID=A0A1E1JVS1_9HELO|nr:uncharacterized protein RCO7_14171 [Rhynchosporium commune]